MRFLFFALHRYQRSWQQVACFAFFLPALALLYLAAIWLKPVWFAGFRMLLLVLGWFAASFIEYYMHRFLYHTPGRKATFLADHHQYHHTHPTEIKLSGSVKAAGLLLLAASLLLAFFFSAYWMIVAGLVCGFCAYAFLHKAIHQPWGARIFPRLFQYHIYHHCKYPNRCFGVSTTLWDVIFKTTPPKGASIPARILQFYLAQHDHESIPV